MTFDLNHLADDLHETSSLFFSEKYIHIKKKM